MTDRTKTPTWLETWDPENEEFWETTGKVIAWRTLRITTANLTMAFAVWFVVSALVVRLGDIGFDLETTQLFWLAALPGLAGGTLRIVNTFLIPVYGTRHVITAASFALLVPLVGWFFAIQNPETPFVVLALLAFLVGVGGGSFSSFMPSTSLFFPKRLQGTALGVQAGVGNFGVSLVQFVVPWIIGFGLLGSLGGPQRYVTADGVSDIWLQNAVFVWIPIVIGFSFWAWFGLRSVPVRASFRDQLDIFGNKHTWLLTSLYVMAFGSFAGLSAAFPLLIKELYGGFENAPDPLAFAFLGPLVGSIMRIAAGPVSDRIGGAKVTMASAVGLLACAIGITFTTEPASKDLFIWFVIWMLGLFFFSGIGNASVYKQIPMAFEARQASGVLGWTAAVAAYGPFAFSMLIAWALSASDTGSPNGFFYGLAVFYAINIAINLVFYMRAGEQPT